jgi:hypothetical protein
VVIVAGVVIALLVDNWRARLQDRELLQTTLEYLSKEFSKNTAKLKWGPEGRDYRRGMELWLTGYMGNEQKLLELYQRFKQVVSRKALWYLFNKLWRQSIFLTII